MTTADLHGQFPRGPTDPEELAVPDLTDESTAIAHALVNDAHALLTIVATRDDRTIHGTAVQLRREMGFADRRLAALRRGLLHDLDVALAAEGKEVENPAPNPYRQVSLSGADETSALSWLSVEDLLEHIRGYYWWYEHTSNPQQRWHISKSFSAARRELVARGYEHDAWMDGTEGDHTCREQPISHNGTPYAT